MNILIIAALFVAGVAPHLADVHSTWLNNANPRIKENRRMFRRLDGHCDLKKLTVFKLVLFAVCAAIAVSLYLFAGAGLVSFAVFPMMGLIAVPVALKNYRLHKNFNL